MSNLKKMPYSRTWRRVNQLELEKISKRIGRSRLKGFLKASGIAFVFLSVTTLIIYCTLLIPDMIMTRLSN